jgi:hypothetical protein
MSTTPGIKTVLHPVSDLTAAKTVCTALLGIERAAIKDAPRDVGGGRLVATVTGPDGNVLGLLQDR